MSREEKAIVDALKSGRFLLSLHVAARMRQRSITEADIRACGRTAKSCVWQPQHGTWRVDGEDLDGESITVICALDSAVIVVTIF